MISFYYRCLGAFFSAFALVLIFGYAFIKKLAFYKIGQVERSDGPQSHLVKNGTPTMGGVFVLLASLISATFFVDFHNFYVLLLIFSLVSFGLIGFYDDFRKLCQHNAKGLSARGKFLWQTFCAAIIGVLLYLKSGNTTIFNFPFWQNLALDLGFFYVIFAMVLVIGSSNAVNLTDGLDGLVSFPVMIILALFSFIILNHLECVAHFKVVDQAVIPLFGSVFGALLGFLWFNSYPASVFMGDTGSLALGAFLGTAAIILHLELVYFIAGFIFVLETLSVILQVTSYKLRRKRIFKMAPIHHHFELLGIPEAKVAMRFWISSLLLSVIAFLSIYHPAS